MQLQVDFFKNHCAQSIEEPHVPQCTAERFLRISPNCKSDPKSPILEGKKKYSHQMILYLVIKRIIYVLFRNPVEST